MQEGCRKDPAYAAEDLNAVLKDGTQKELMLAVRRIGAAFGITEVAESALTEVALSRDTRQ